MIPRADSLKWSLRAIRLSNYGYQFSLLYLTWWTLFYSNIIVPPFRLLMFRKLLSSSGHTKAEYWIGSTHQSDEHALDKHEKILRFPSQLHQSQKKLPFSYQATHRDSIASTSGENHVLAKFQATCHMRITCLSLRHKRCTYYTWSKQNHFLSMILNRL